jgi:hypothetical protein
MSEMLDTREPLKSTTDKLRLERVSLVNTYKLAKMPRTKHLGALTQRDIPNDIKECEDPVLKKRASEIFIAAKTTHKERGEVYKEVLDYRKQLKKQRDAPIIEKNRLEWERFLGEYLQYGS